MEENKKQRSHKVFYILYTVCFLGAGVIAFFGNSFFAYDIFNSLWADILYFLFMSLLFVTAFAQEVYDCPKPLNIFVNFLIFIVGLAIFLLVTFFGRVVFIVALIHSAVALSYIGIRYALSAGSSAVKVDIKQAICAMSGILIATVGMFRVEFVDETFMAWSLLPAVVVFGIIVVTAYFLLKTSWKTLLGNTKAKRIANAVMLVFAALFMAYFYSFVAVGCINCAYENEYTSIECVILDKHVSSGANTVTEFEVKVEIDGKEKWINLPVTDYHSLEEGGSVYVHYYKGTLGFPFWTYGGIVEAE